MTRRPVVVLFCCQDRKARLFAAQFWKIVLGGTAALHAPRVWGAVSFWGQEENAQHPTVEVTSLSSLPGLARTRDHVAQP